MKILYFAWVRERVGHGAEDRGLPPAVSTVAGLVEHLVKEGEGYAAACVDLKRIRVAVNEEHVGFDHTVSEGDEVAFFPPVTGG